MRLVAVTACACLAPLFACSSDPSETTPPEPTCGTDLSAFRFAHGGYGHADPFGARAAGQARAGRIRDVAQIVQTADARHPVRVGDFALANEKIALYIEAEGESDGYFTFGGDILSIEPVSADGRPKGVSHFGESVFFFSRQTVAPDRVSVLADGSDGGAAIVRVSGVLKNIALLDPFQPLMPDEFGFPIAIDYVLEPGAEQVVVRLNMTNPRPEVVDFASKQFIGFFQSSRSSAFFEGSGFAKPNSATPYVAWVEDDVGFAVRALGSPMRPELSQAGFEYYSVQGLSLGACETRTLDYAQMTTGAPGVDGLLEAKRRAWGEAPWRAVEGTLKEAETNLPLAGAVVVATATDGRVLTRARTDASGAFVVHLPSEPATLTPTLAGWMLPQPTDVSSDASSIALTLPRRATLVTTATDATTAEALPVRVEVRPKAAFPNPPDGWGIRNEGEGVLFRDHALTGRSELPVAPGTYRVIVTRGYEYELLDTEVTAEAGQTTNIAAPLAHSVDSTGVMCADFHVHSFYSADSSDPVETKVKSAIADGLDIPVSSEHEYVVDFAPVIARLGMNRWAFGFSSEELTTFSWGHFGVIPLTVRPEATNRGAIPWIGKMPAEIFRSVNELPEKPVLVVNHPSSPGLGGYFSQAQFDRSKATGRPDLWSDDFAAVEAFSGDDFESSRGSSVGDWFALLNSGRSVWTTGSSDSHDIRSSPVGYPRNCLRFGHDDPRLLTAETVRDVLRAGTNIVSGGLTMTVEGPGGILPGGTSQAGDYEVSVSCPSWTAATSLEVIVDGTTTQTIPLTPAVAPGPGRRYDAVVKVVPIESRTRHWVVFHASGTGDLAPLHPGRKPFAASNPIFF